MVIGPPFSIWRRKSGITEPFEPSTLPKRTAANEVFERAEIEIKYAGYIKRQLSQAEQFKKLEGRVIPEGIDYSQIKGLRLEAQQKLGQIRPENIGRASRISGVSPADIAALMIYLEK